MCPIKLERHQHDAKRKVAPTPWFLRKCRIQRSSATLILYLQISQDLQAQQELGYADSKGFGRENIRRAPAAGDVEGRARGGLCCAAGRSGGHRRKGGGSDRRSVVLRTL